LRVVRVRRRGRVAITRPETIRIAIRKPAADSSESMGFTRALMPLVVSGTVDGDEGMLPRSAAIVVEVVELVEVVAGANVGDGAVYAGAGIGAIVAGTAVVVVTGAVVAVVGVRSVVGVVVGAAVMGTVVTGSATVVVTWAGTVEATDGLVWAPAPPACASRATDTVRITTADEANAAVAARSCVRRV
jgi:hypothetical protein